MYYPYIPLQLRKYRDQPQQHQIITVTGEGNISIQPNLVNIQLAVVNEDESLSKAQQENAAVMSQVIQSLLALEIPRENIRTTSYNINPRYDYVDGRQIFRAYQITNEINVEIGEIDQAGTVIDTAVQNGINRVGNIQFTVEERQVYYQQALRAALDNALAKAQAIAQAMQLNLDPTPVRIIERAPSMPDTFIAMTTTADESFTTPIEPGQIIIRASVETQFQYYPL
ncbi:SIMPL domain-containing protein [Virgibacillus sp. C22-A2]|uniref:SIMPL domain-containing protein n=1 Tax=Virgibacillus tibetensis TaxID=3042313 RepID=A0ABU6KME7_9BACI|nr:SIMPL domain-containing protein [Virgibacillus sp. C22-A2]MEC5425702.1 SIMPL domain-containing protein [Virgibacillus sp. C22-A2]